MIFPLTKYPISSKKLEYEGEIEVDIEKVGCR